MTNEQAKDIIEKYLSLDSDVDSEYIQAQKVAINALNRVPCEDCISRQAAIDALGKRPIAWEQGEYEDGMIAEWESDLEAIKDLPSAQPEQRWIPVSERLPEKDGDYYVFGNGEVWICEFISLMHVKGWANSVNNPPVKAWMPLPEPYREGQE